MPDSFSDKLFRSLFKYIYKISHSKAFNHNRRYWPYFKIERGQNGLLNKVYYKSQLIADNMTPVTSPNNTCVIVATGPSINDIDDHFFQNKNFDYLGLNGAISLDYAHFNLYVVIDHDFIHNKFNLVEKILTNQQCILFTTPRCLELILRRYQIKEILCTFKIIELITENKLEKFLGPQVKIDDQTNDIYMLNHFGFSTQIFRQVFDYYTVAYVALQIAYALNYKLILLVGLDMNNFNQPRFYESLLNKQPTRLDQDFEAISQAFETAAQFLKTEQIELHNLSMNSAIEVFTKTHFSKFL